MCCGPGCTRAVQQLRYFVSCMKMVLRIGCVRDGARWTVARAALFCVVRQCEACPDMSR